MTNSEVTTPELLSLNSRAFWSGGLPGWVLNCGIESDPVFEKAWNDLYDGAQSDEMVDVPTIVKAK